MKNTISKSPFIPLLQRGSEVPSNKSGQGGCPLFGKEGAGEILKKTAAINQENK